MSKRRNPWDDPEPIIYCPEHALQATNIGFMLNGIEPAETMEEAAAVIMTVLTLNGEEDANTFITSIEGAYTCERCEELATLTHNHTEGENE